MLHVAGNWKFFHVTLQSVCEFVENYYPFERIPNPRLLFSRVSNFLIFLVEIRRDGRNYVLLVVDFDIAGFSIKRSIRGIRKWKRTRKWNLIFELAFCRRGEKKKKVSRNSARGRNKIRRVSRTRGGMDKTEKFRTIRVSFHAICRK